MAENKIANNTVNSGEKMTNQETASWRQLIEELPKKFDAWFDIEKVISRINSAVKQMVDSVIKLDSAMSRLKKVTNETSERYNRFLSNAAVRAKQLGAALTDTISATADFASLGYSLDDAEKIADAAILYKNVGDGISNIETASKSIIAAMQAFGTEAKDTIKIVDKLSAAGNSFAVSSKGVGDVLISSAESMKTANNSLDETIALAAVANAAVHDSEKAGTALNTVSFFLRAASSEAEAAGLSTKGMAGSVSELRNEILSLTGNRIDIQFDNGTLKSTYQILNELSEVWSSLTTSSKADILELTGGENSSDVVSALLNNFKAAESAVTASAKSAGFALAKNEKYLNSVDGKITQFSTAFQVLSQDTVDSNFVKSIIDIGTGLVNILDGLQKIHLLLPSIIGIVTAAGLGKKNVGGDKMYSLYCFEKPTIIHFLWDTKVLVLSSVRYIDVNK